ncbi:MAG TPA: ImcF-related family protein [Gemmatimonadaceae bacterium]|nr:ImcF-related family protein [Gemmatimonadaceae bacterium]
MSRKAKIWLIATAVFLVFVIAVWFLGPALHLKSPDIWVFRAGLWVLGAAAAGFVVWYFLRQLAPAPASGTRTDDIDAAMNAARAQLAASRASGKSTTLARAPMVILLGSEGSAKTTVVVRSGLEAELLAGSVSRDDTVAPTKGVNVWYARDTVFVEAGGPLAADPSRFARLIRHVQPRRLAAVFGGGSQASRLAVVCVSCDHLVQPGASEQAVALGKMLHDRLSELARGLGIRLPVYVVFTKADRIAYFADYVRNFSNDEAREVVGVTLPADVGAVGLYADRQAKRVADSFQRLFVSLADKRIQYLGREAAAEPKPGAYEFPRELRKTGAVVTQFLVELCRPSQLQVSPFLRGYYFTGVRPVFINDAAPAAAAAAAQQSRGEARSATAVFRAEQLAAQSRAPAPAAATRKVPQWVFLGRLFTDVLLGDRAAMHVTKGGARVNTLRRVALGLATAAGVVVALGFTVSWSGNRTLAETTAADAHAALTVAAGTGAPTVETLQRLDALRAQLQTLRDYERNGPPTSLEWGLYSGSAMLPEARRAYFASFDKLLFEDTRGALTTSLRAVPAAPRPTDDYGSTYRVLKAYLITTANPERSTEDFLAPVLLNQWSGVRSADSVQSQLAQRQFAFYARELPLGDPYSVPADTALVGRARSFLRQFTGIEPIYQAMLAEADSGNAAIQFNKMVPGSAAYVVERNTVRGAFTKPGYAAMQRALGSADRFFQGERWVLGDEPPSQVDKTKALADLRARYESDYIAAWRDYLQGAAIARYGSVSDAAAKLAQLSGNQSPLLSLISIASQNTNTDTAIGNAMQPAHAVVPPGQTDKLIGAPVQAYMAALLTLQGSLGQVATAPPGQSEGAIANATQNANAARGEAQKLAQGFVVGREPAVATAVQRLLTEPLASIDPYLRNYGAGQLNGKGQTFCSKNAGLFAKYPFNDRSPIQASLDEVAAVFKPQTGSLWTYYNDALQNVIQPQGSSFAAKSGGTLNVNPAFLSFFNRATQFSAAIFPAGANEPRLTMTLTNYLMPQSGRLRVVGDGNTVDYAAAVKPHQFTWMFQPSGEATIAVEQGNVWANVASFHGTWAVFQMFGAASSWEATASDYRAEWAIPGNSAGAKVGLDVALNNVPPVMRKGFFSGFACVSKVVQ